LLGVFVDLTRAVKKTPFAESQLEGPNKV
jgi:hypothetical protein